MAAANDELKISSCDFQAINGIYTPNATKNNHPIEQTSETEMPKDWNFLAYCILDFVELFVTKTSFFPYKQPMNNM